MTERSKHPAQPRDPQKQYVTVEEAAYLLNHSERTVRRLIRNKQLHVVYDAGGFVRIDLDDIHARNAQKPHLPHPILASQQAMQEQINILARRLDLMQEEINVLKVGQGAELRTLPALPPAKPPVSAAQKRGYAPGTQRLVDFASTHQVTVGSIKSLFEAGVIELAVYHRPTNPQRNKLEWWITPEQHLAIADYWQAHDMLFTTCPQCELATEEAQGA